MEFSGKLYLISVLSSWRRHPPALPPYRLAQNSTTSVTTRRRTKALPGIVAACVFAWVSTALASLASRGRLRSWFGTRLGASNPAAACAVLRSVQLSSMSSSSHPALAKGMSHRRQPSAPGLLASRMGCAVACELVGCPRPREACRHGAAFVAGMAGPVRSRGLHRRSLLRDMVLRCERDGPFISRLI